MSCGDSPWGTSSKLGLLCPQCGREGALTPDQPSFQPQIVPPLSAIVRPGHRLFPLNTLYLSPVTFLHPRQPHFTSEHVNTAFSCDCYPVIVMCCRNKQVETCLCIDGHGSWWQGGQGSALRPVDTYGAALCGTRVAACHLCVPFYVCCL